MIWGQTENCHLFIIDVWASHLTSSSFRVFKCKKNINNKYSQSYYGGKIMGSCPVSCRYNSSIKESITVIYLLIIKLFCSRLLILPVSLDAG